MGLGSDVIGLLSSLKEKGALPSKKSVMEIGAQQLANSFLDSKEELVRLGLLFGATKPCPLLAGLRNQQIVHGTLEHLSHDAPEARIFWEWLGYTYSSIDVDSRFASLSIDLNFDSVPERECHEYALVTNYGTTEHVANQLNAFKVIHDLTMPGGLMLHRLPAQGMFNHGLVNYNPKFFWMLCRSNGYMVVHFEFGGDTTAYPLPSNILDFVEPHVSDVRSRLASYSSRDCYLMVVLRKSFDIEFVPPIDVPTGTETDDPVLLKRYWTVFKADAFADLRSGDSGIKTKARNLVKQIRAKFRR